MFIIFREKITSASAGFHVGPLSWSNWNLEMLVFVGGGKPRENPEKKREPNIWHREGIEPWPHYCWEMGALTTAPEDRRCTNARKNRLTDKPETLEADWFTKFKIRPEHLSRAPKALI